MASRYFIIETLTGTIKQDANEVFNKLKSVVGKETASKILLSVEVTGTYTITGSGDILTIRRIDD